MRAWLEVDLDALAHNYDIVRRKVGSDVDIMAIVKADAYGHGITPIAGELDWCGIDSFAVISLEEAREVRKQSPKPVLVMGYLDAREIAEAIDEGFILSLYDKELLPLYERIGERVGKVARVHLKIETGLNRLGITIDDAVDILSGKHRFPHVSIEAVMSHLAKAGNRESNLVQLREVQDFLVKLQEKTPILPIHLASSEALGNFPDGYFDAVRVGLALYGVDEALPGLQPTLTCKTVVMQVKQISQGEGVSYGHLFVADKDMEIAVIAIGYAEGYTQALTGKCEVLVRGKRAKVLGKICMNLCVIDVTGLGVKRGEEVVVVGQQKDESGHSDQIKIADLATAANLRHHEIITRFGTVLPRIYKGGSNHGR